MVQNQLRETQLQFGRHNHDRPVRLRVGDALQCNGKHINHGDYDDDDYYNDMMTMMMMMITMMTMMMMSIMLVTMLTMMI